MTTPDHAPDMFGVTEDMRRWKSAPTADGTRTVVLAAFLTPFNGAMAQQISTSFIHLGTSSVNLVGQAALFVDRSAGAFASGSQVDLHVVHDKADFEMEHAPNLPCVRFHRFAAEDEQSGMRFRAAATDRRWHMYEHVLNSLGSDWDCAWAVDLTDVVMLRLPPCGALPDDRLAIARDGLGSAPERGFLKWLGQQARVAEVWTDFGQWLHTTEQPILNSGLVGGRRAAMRPLVSFMARRTAAMWRRPTLASNWSMDMLTINQAVYDAKARPELGAAAAGAVIHGFPNGPTNLPMWGNFHWHPSLTANVKAKSASRASRSATSNFYGGVLRALTNESFMVWVGNDYRLLRWWCDEVRFACRRAYLRLTRGMHWFGHKLPKQWLDPTYGLQPAVSHPTRCDPPPSGPFELVALGFDCCVRDRGGNPQPPPRRSHSRLLHTTDHGYAYDASECEQLCVRLNCSFYSFSEEWHKCSFCDGLECPYAAPTYGTAWSNRTRIIARVRSAYYVRSEPWRTRLAQA